MMRDFIVNVKQYYTRGSTWFSYLFQIGIITANAKLFEEFFHIWFGWNVMQTIAVGVVGYITVATIIGGLDLHYGIWKQENDWVWNSTPEARQMSENVRKLVKELCREQE